MGNTNIPGKNKYLESKSSMELYIALPGIFYFLNQIQKLKERRRVKMSKWEERREDLTQ